MSEPTEHPAEGREPAEAAESVAEAAEPAAALEAAEPAEAVGPTSAIESMEAIESTSAAWTASAIEPTEAAGPTEATETIEPGPASAPGPSRVHRARVAFRGWRRSRPFWGGLIVVLGAAEILTTYQAPFGIIVHFGLYGLAGYLVPIILGLLGLMIIFEPAHRTFYSVLAVLAALGTWLTSNLGGFFIGMLLGLVGGCLAFGWQYGERPERPARAQHTKRRRFRVRARAAE